MRESISRVALLLLTNDSKIVFTGLVYVETIISSGYVYLGGMNKRIDYLVARDGKIYYDGVLYDSYSVVYTDTAEVWISAVEFDQEKAKWPETVRCTQICDGYGNSDDWRIGKQCVKLFGHEKEHRYTPYPKKKGGR